MANEHMRCINTDAIANLLVNFTEAQAIMEFTEDESQGVIKFIMYLIKEWEVKEYIN